MFAISPFYSIKFRYDLVHGDWNVDVNGNVVGFRLDEEFEYTFDVIEEVAVIIWRWSQRIYPTPEELSRSSAVGWVATALETTDLITINSRSLNALLKRLNPASARWFELEPMGDDPPPVAFDYKYLSCWATAAKRTPSPDSVNP